MKAYEILRSFVVKLSQTPQHGQQNQIFSSCKMLFHEMATF